VDAPVCSGVDVGSVVGVDVGSGEVTGEVTGVDVGAGEVTGESVGLEGSGGSVGVLEEAAQIRHFQLPFFLPLSFAKL